MRLIADLHIHSRFSRATSRDMDLVHLSRWAKWKGIDILGTGDFTHPDWFRELEANLVPAGEGVYRYGETLFLLTCELAAIWSAGGKVRRVHFLVLAPDLAAVSRINRELAKLGNLAADGRPTFGVSGERLVATLLGACPEAVVIPAHAWTPWYSIFGANSGFDSLEEALGKAASHVLAIETGLSSDPPMNWRLSALDRVALVSFSDAHSPARLGREACVFDLPEASYPSLVEAIRTRDPKRFLYTIEFFPEEGKYHYDGHRACGVVLSPKETRAHGGRCPACGRPLTIGVMHRVEALADRPEGTRPPGAIPYRSLVPLEEIIAQALGQGRDTKGVREEYLRLVSRFGSELRILLDLPEKELSQGTPPQVLLGIRKVRAGELQIRPGYDGVYGEIRIPLDEGPRELSLF
ncbi:DNA helicase UvrD [Candidatus Bipolaricaulota bacterium]|nr:DNA helicase UvrD [Candidatus Bipolaricaulota bacterium]